MCDSRGAGGIQLVKESMTDGRRRERKNCRQCVEGSGIEANGTRDLAVFTGLREIR